MRWGARAEGTLPGRPWHVLRSREPTLTLPPALTCDHQIPVTGPITRAGPSLDASVPHVSRAATQLQDRQALPPTQHQTAPQTCPPAPTSQDPEYCRPRWGLALGVCPAAWAWTECVPWGPWVGPLLPAAWNVATAGCWQEHGMQLVGSAPPTTLLTGWEVGINGVPQIPPRLHKCPPLTRPPHGLWAPERGHRG